MGLPVILTGLLKPEWCISGGGWFQYIHVQYIHIYRWFQCIHVQYMHIGFFVYENLLTLSRRRSLLCRTSLFICSANQWAGFYGPLSWKNNISSWVVIKNLEGTFLQENFLNTSSNFFAFLYLEHHFEWEVLTTVIYCKRVIFSPSYLILSWNAHFTRRLIYLLGTDTLKWLLLNSQTDRMSN